MKTGKVLMIGSVALLTLSYFKRLFSSSSQIETEVINTKISVKQARVNLIFDVLIKNASSANIRIQFPFVKVHFKGSSLGSSVPRDKQVTIKSNSQTTIEAIELNLPLLSIGSRGLELFRRLINRSESKETIELDVEISTMIFTPVSKIKQVFNKKIKLE